MSDKEDDQPTQETPEGATIPVPTRKDVFRDLEKVAKPSPGKGDSRPEQ
jgi:hypothetical protein